MHMSSSSNTKSSGKRKEREHPESRARKKKSSRIGVQLLSNLNQLIESMSTRSDSTSVNMDFSGCSIPEVMVEFHSIPKLSFDDEFFDFITEFLGLQRKREMWSSMKTLEQKYSWLQ